MTNIFEEIGQGIENAIVTTYDDAKAIFMDIVTGVKGAEAKAGSLLSWIAGQVPNIAADVKAVETDIELVEAAFPGFSQNAAVTTAIADANSAVAGLNAFATAADAGTNNVTAAITGFSAFEAANAATASASAAVASAAAAKAPAA
jgi:hypothetical protein